MIGLFVADDHEVVREGIRRIVQDEGDLEIVEEAKTGDEVLRQVPSTRADVLLLDLSMPGPGFLKTIRGVQQARPDLPVLVLSVHPEELWAVQALRAGAAGYLTKSHSARELTDAVRKVRVGGRYVTRSLGELLAREVSDETAGGPHTLLSERELQVLGALGSGKRPKRIAMDLGLSPKTISTYRSRLMKKLGLDNNAELVKYVLSHGLELDPDLEREG